MTVVWRHSCYIRLVDTVCGGSLKATMVYTGIRVKDIEKSIEFYTKLLGMQLVGRSKVEAANGEVVDLRGSTEGPYLELNAYEKGSRFDTPYSPGEGLDHLAFRVENLEDAIREFEAAGHPVVLEIQGKSGKWVYIQDPDGNYIELMS